MDDHVKALLLSADVDLDGVLERFMDNEDLFLRFFRKFKKDDNYWKLKDSLQREDWKGAFNEAHTLKGVSGNLGLNRLYAASCDITERLRTDELADLDGRIAVLDTAYMAVVRVIDQLS